MRGGKAVRTAVLRCEAALEQWAVHLPRTAAAFSAMKAALDEEAPQRGSKRPLDRGAPRQGSSQRAPYAGTEASLIKRLRNRVQYLERVRNVLRQLGSRR